MTTAEMAEQAANQREREQRIQLPPLQPLPQRQSLFLDWHQQLFLPWHQQLFLHWHQQLFPRWHQQLFLHWHQQLVLHWHQQLGIRPPPPPSTAPGQLEGRTRRRQRGNGDSIDYAVLAG